MLREGESYERPSKSRSRRGLICLLMQTLSQAAVRDAGSTYYKFITPPNPIFHHSIPETGIIAAPLSLCPWQVTAQHSSPEPARCACESSVCGFNRKHQPLFPRYQKEASVTPAAVSFRVASTSQGAPPTTAPGLGALPPSANFQHHVEEGETPVLNGIPDRNH